MDIPVRKMAFEFPDDMDFVFIEDDPGQSYVFLGGWLMLPYLEPYLIRTLQAAIPEVDDPELKEDMKRFCLQEGQHYRQHALANEVVHGRSAASEELKKIEAELEADYQRFSSEKSLKFNLAYAEAFEAMTAASARTQFEVDVFRYMKGPLKDLMEWHVMEELEHRTVAFEAYEAISGSYVYRVVAGAWAQYHYWKYVIRLAKVLRAADAEALKKYDQPDLKEKVADRTKEMTKVAMPRWISIYSPFYHPRKLEMPPQFEEARKRYSDIAVAIS